MYVWVDVGMPHHGSGGLETALRCGFLSSPMWVLGLELRLGSKCPHSLSQAFPFAPCSLVFTSTCALISFPCGIFCSSIISSLTGLLLSAPRFQFIPLHLTTQPTCNLRSPPCHRQIKSGGGKLSGCDWLGL